MREGIFTRDEALRIVEEENRPRYDAVRDYLKKVGLDYDEVIKKIDAIPKLYEELDFK